MNSLKVDILVIEDSTDDAELTIRAMKKNNDAYSIVHISTGEDALDYLFCQGTYQDRDRRHNPKLILLDLKMPRVNGIEVLRRIKWDERTKAIPVVVLTSSKEEQDIMESYMLGANSYFVKPVDFDFFVNAMSDLLHYWLDLNQSPNKDYD